MPTINSIYREQLQRSVHEESEDDAQRALTEIIENHRAAGMTVQEGTHNGRPAWHVMTLSGRAFAVFWISDRDEGSAA